MNLKFYLRKDKKTKHGDYPIYMLITFNSERIRIPAKGVHTLEDQWDEHKEKIRKPARAKSEEIDLLNYRLDEIKSTISEIAREAFKNNVRLTNQYILERLNDKSIIYNNHKNFFELVEKYIEAVRPVTAPQTIRSKTYVFNFLKDFEKESQSKITLESISLEWFERLRKFAFDNRKVSDNYFAKIIRVLKSFLNWAIANKHTYNTDFKNFRAREREGEIICLTIEEFQNLSSHHFKNPTLDKVRDIFIFGCSTGLRFSDLNSLKSTDIKGEYIVKTTQKTKEQITIPLNTYGKAILNKYAKSPHDPIPKMSQQKYNDYLKECCKEVGIDTPTTITMFSGEKENKLSFRNINWLQVMLQGRHL